MLVLYNY